MIDKYSSSQEEDKLYCYAHLRKFGILKFCDGCGVAIILKCHQLSEVHYPQSWTYFKRVPPKRSWIAFDADQPNHKHECKEQRNGLRQEPEAGGGIFLRQ